MQQYRQVFNPVLSFSSIVKSLTQLNHSAVLSTRNQTERADSTTFSLSPSPFRSAALRLNHPLQSLDRTAVTLCFTLRLKMDSETAYCLAPRTEDFRLTPGEIPKVRCLDIVGATSSGKCVLFKRFEEPGQLMLNETIAYLLRVRSLTASPELATFHLVEAHSNLVKKLMEETDHFANKIVLSVEKITRYQIATPAVLLCKFFEGVRALTVSPHEEAMHASGRKPITFTMDKKDIFIEFINRSINQLQIFIIKKYHEVLVA